MANYLVQNVNHPVASAHRAGVFIQTVNSDPDAARAAFVALHPAVAGDIIEVIDAGPVPYKAFVATATISFSGATPTFPAPNT